MNDDGEYTAREARLLAAARAVAGETPWGPEARWEQVVISEKERRLLGTARELIQEAPAVTAPQGASITVAITGAERTLLDATRALTAARKAVRDISAEAEVMRRRVSAAATAERAAYKAYEEACDRL